MRRSSARRMKPVRCSLNPSQMMGGGSAPTTGRSTSRTAARSSPAIYANISGRKASPSAFRFRRKGKFMYAYDEIDRTLINERVSEFRDQVQRRLSGELA